MARDVEKPSVLFEGAYEAVFSLTPDGRFVLIRNTAEASAPTVVQVVLDWLDELKRRVQ